MPLQKTGSRPPPWLIPLLALIGAAAGAILLPALLLAWFDRMNDAGGPMFFVLALFAAVAIGAALGAAFGLMVGVIAWFILRR